HRLRIRLGQASFSWRVERRDLAVWLRQPMPVILVVYDARKDTAYWLYVQRYFQRLRGFNLFAAGESVTVCMPVAHLVNTNAMRKFARFRARVVKQMGEIIHADD